jgi:DENN domain-containing protein 11
MRGARLLSVGVLVAPSLRPRPWRHIAALKRFAVHLEDHYKVKKPLVDYFDLHKARGLSLGEPEVWTGWNDELSNATVSASMRGNDITSTTALTTTTQMDHPAFHLSHILRILGISSLTIFKHALGRRRVLIYTQPPVEPACLLAQLAAVISSGEEGDSGVATNRISVLGVVGLFDLPRIERETESGRGWIACS